MIELLAQAIDWSVIDRISRAAILVTVAPLFPFLYVVLRWREPSGSGSGTYGALLYFRTVAVLLIVAGMANLTYGQFSVTPVEPEMKQLSWGLFWGGMTFLAINLGLGRALAPTPSKQTLRVFVGFLLVVAGMMALFSLVMLFYKITWDVKTNYLREEKTDKILLYGVWSAYYLTTYAVAQYALVRSLRVRVAGSNV